MTSSKLCDILEIRGSCFSQYTVFKGCPSSSLLFALLY